MTYQERIYSQAIADGFPDNFARLMVAWASHETAYNGIPFNSPVFRTCRNAYGYKWVGQSTADGSCSQSPELDYYAKYNSLEASVREVVLWVKRRQREGVFPADLRTITTPYQLAVLLQNAGYYKDTLNNYYSGLNRWWQQVQNLSLATKTAGVGILLIVGGVLAYHFRKQLFNKKAVSIFT